MDEMGLATMQFYSNAIGKHTSYNVIVPEVGEGPFPVLFQLHGLTDDYQCWVQRSNIIRHAAEYPLVIAFPDGGTHFYTNWRDGGRIGKGGYEDLIVTDISNHLKRHFHVTDGPWAIGGLSMGGYGSLKLGMKHPDRFASIWAHSSKIETSGTGIDLSLIADPGDADIVTHARRLLEREQKPVISFDCGVDDEGIIDENRRLHTKLDEMGLEHHYAEHAGGHDCGWSHGGPPLLSIVASEVERLVAA
jgi:putative tributyrin esterase